MNKEKQLEQAIAVIKDLLKYGLRDGPCTNEDFTEEPCELHMEASKRREQAARAFLNSLE